MADTTNVVLRPFDTGLGHYRAISLAAAVNGLTAGQIIASLTWRAPSPFFVLTRLSAQFEVLTAITTACVLDLKAFVFRGASAVASGTGSTTLTLTGNNQKMKSSMAATQFSAFGEIRTAQGAAQPITAAASKVNDGAPFGWASFGTLFDTSGTGTAVLVKPGAAVTPGGWNDLYTYTPGTQHPLVLGSGEGIEIQVHTANNTDGTVTYAFLWEWIETNTYP